MLVTQLILIKKCKALKDKTGFDVDRALIHIEEEKIEEKEGQLDTSETRTRRVKPVQEPTGRRTTPTYNVTKKG